MENSNIVEINQNTNAGPSTIPALAVLGKQSVTDIVNTVKQIPVMKEEDYQFLMAHNEHLGLVMEKTYIWRTPLQKMSIINDIAHHTAHSKFHQAILEQKVQFEQSLYLAKEFEEKKLKVEELECDLEELEANETMSEKRKDIKRRSIALEINFAQFELNSMKIAMEYRMSEVKGWQEIEEALLTEMRAAGIPEDTIWQKEADEIEDLFFRIMYNLHGINKTTDGGEYNNLVSLAVFIYKEAVNSNMIGRFMSKADPKIVSAVQFVQGVINGQPANATGSVQ